MWGMNIKRVPNYKFGQWKKLTVIKEGWDSIQFSEVKVAADSFTANANRILNLPEIVEASFIMGGFHGQNEVLARYLVIEKKYDPFASGDYETNKVKDAFQKIDLTRALLADNDINLPPLPSWHHGLSWSGEASLKAIQGSMGSQIESIMLMQLVGGWTAFETLCGDLWEAAINILPEHMVRGGKEAKWEDIKEATRGTFDLSGKVGACT